jgi:hypothetical protein
MDFRTFARSVLGRQPGMVVGRDVSTEEFEADKKAYDYYVKKGIDQAMSVQQPVQPPQFMSLTNAEGRVIDVLVKPDGTPQVVEPRVQNTQQGIMTMVNPTNAVPLVNPQTGQPLMGYAADPMGSGPMPSIGGPGMAATNAPTAAPAQTPAPSPTPYPEGATIRGKSDGLLYKVVNGVPQLIPGQ